MSAVDEYKGRFIRAAEMLPTSGKVDRAGTA
jgi:hypothetical protein